MAELAEAMADSPLHGYSQKPPSGRWGPDFDCASFIFFIANAVGYDVGIGKDKVRYTGTMLEEFKDAGFQLLPFANVGVSDLQIGDILVNLALHAEICVGDGQVVGAQASETGGYVGMAGDQTGEEIKKQPVYIYEKGWDYVLRPPMEEEPEAGEEPEEEGEDEMATYPYNNSTMGGGNWMPNSGMSNVPRTTMPMNGGWMPPVQNYPMGGYPQGNLGQMNGYSGAGNGYQQPGQMGQMGYQQPNQMGGYPQGQSGRHLIHVADFNEVRDVHVNPGECVPVFIGEGKHMALKSADQEGFPSIRVFDLNECTEDYSQQQSPMGGMMGSQGVMQEQGVSRQEIDQLKEMIANVQSAISGAGYPQGNGQPTDGPNASNGAGSQSAKAQSSSRNSRNS